MEWMKQLQIKIFTIISAWLMMDVKALRRTPLIDFGKISTHIKVGDVLLVDGRSRVSQVIKLMTQSRWSHASIYIGRYNELTDTEVRQWVKKFYRGSEDEPLLIESQMGQGVIITPLSAYQHEHVRLCRPTALSHKDAHKLVKYCVTHLGIEYDVQQIFDLARFLMPWGIVPPRWRRAIFKHNAGEPTHASCSRLLAEAFNSVRYPILPDVIYSETAEIEVVQRNARLFTPSDFDNSPFFDILKFPIFDVSEVSFYHKIHWRDDLLSNDRDGLVSVPNPSPSDHLTTVK